MIRVKLPLTGNPAHDAVLVTDMLVHHPNTRLMLSHDGDPTSMEERYLTPDWYEFEAHRLATSDTVIPARALKFVPKLVGYECKRQHQARLDRATE